MTGNQIIPPSPLRNVQLRFVCESDAPFILALRTNPKLSQFMSPVDASLEKQQEWLRSYKQREAGGTEFYFIVMHDSKPVGTIRAYDFRPDSFSWGSWIVAPGSPQHVALASCIQIYDFGFHSLGFNSSHFESRQANKRVVQFHLRLGASIVKSDENNHYFELTKANYRAMRPKLISILQN